MKQTKRISYKGKKLKQNKHMHKKQEIQGNCMTTKITMAKIFMVDF